MKQFRCPRCGRKVFKVVYQRSSIVNFEKEGAVEGHPFLEEVVLQFLYVVCNHCNIREIPEEVEEEMLKEII